MLISMEQGQLIFDIILVNKDFLWIRCLADDEELTLAAINMKLPFIQLNKVEPTKDGKEIQKKIGK